MPVDESDEVLLENSDRFLTISCIFVITKKENTPRVRHKTASVPMLINSKGDTSVAFSLSMLRLLARNVIPNAFTKHAAASPPVNVRQAAPKMKILFINIEEVAIPLKRLWNVSHSLTNPLNGGRPEIATAPTKKNIAVYGISFMSPPYSSILRV